MLSVEDALVRVTADLEPTAQETVSLENGYGRVLAEDVAAHVTQPPFDASAMDGYAVRAADVADVPCTLTIVGEAAAGHPWEGSIGAGEAVRIFTGGAVPEVADAIVIQEDTVRDGARVTIKERAERGTFIRPRGFDFSEGDVLLRAGRRLNARDLTLAAAMNVIGFSVRRRPVVAMLATGDELVVPGDDLKPGQIVSSIPYGLAELIRTAGGEAIRLGIARDTEASLAEHIAKARDADILVTIGGASVGEHDLVQSALTAAGMSLDFWRIAMRPGKPLMFGQMGAQRVLGVPGNPVSALVCSRIFLVPMIERLLGLNQTASATRTATLAGALERNGPRQHYMRATFETGADGETRVAPVRSQDSSLMAPLSQADCLIVRPPDAPAAQDGETIEILPLDF
ncbi:MAG: molybdopterin molybdotransferase MoeA [Hyphomicrobiaceae bacterium]|nr:molybdopterin molybdotransferase MoeA [Hyphomicrobiaceae bacterium]